MGSRFHRKLYTFPIVERTFTLDWGAKFDFQHGLEKSRTYILPETDVRFFHVQDRSFLKFWEQSFSSRRQ